MCLFRRRQKVKQEEDRAPPSDLCLHKYKAFGNYGAITISMTDGAVDPRVSLPYRYKVFRLYCCIKCGKERQEELYTTLEEGIENCKKIRKELEEKGLSIESAANLFQKVRDFQLIDEAYLEVARKVYPERDI